MRKSATGLLIAAAIAVLFGNSCSVPKLVKANTTAITNFMFAKNDGDNVEIASTRKGNVVDTTITIVVEDSIAKASLKFKPTITVASGATIVPPSGSEQDFSKPVTYTVTGGDGSVQTYTVIVKQAPSGGKEITEFVFKGEYNQALSEDVKAAIRGTGISITVADTVTAKQLKSLKPTITASPGAVVTPESETVQDFSKPVVYTVTAMNGTKKTYTATVRIAERSAAEITGFVFRNGDNTALSADATAAVTGTNITLTLPSGVTAAQRRNLTPTITLSPGATVSPASGTARDFSNEVTYTVTAADGTTTKDFTVTVGIAASSAAEITAFVFRGSDNTALSADATATVTGTNITLTLPSGVTAEQRKSLKPTITLSAGATVSPASGVVQDFSNEVTYTVTAADGTTTKTFTVTVGIAASSTAEIDTFVFRNGDNAVLSADAPATVTGTNITLTLPAGVTAAQRRNLTPTITLSPGATVSPGSGTARDFSNEVTYTVTAADGTTTKTFTVTVGITASSAAEITAFVFRNGDNTALSADAQAAVTGTNITLTLPSGVTAAQRRTLTPTITLSPGATVSPASGAVQDFSNEVTYTVTAADGTTTKTFTVTVGIAASSAAEITAFVFRGSDNTALSADAQAAVTGTNITLTLPSGVTAAQRRTLTPTITLSPGATVSPASGAVQDFSNEVTYTVTAADGTTTKTFTVTVGIAASSAAEITAFVFRGSDNTALSADATAAVTGTNITLTLPSGVTAAQRRNLTPTITLSAGATVSPASGTARDFSNEVTYTVTAADGTTTKAFTVTLTRKSGLFGTTGTLNLSAKTFGRFKVAARSDGNYAGLASVGKEVYLFQLEAGKSASDAASNDISSLEYSTANSVSGNHFLDDVKALHSSATVGGIRLAANPSTKKVYATTGSAGLVQVDKSSSGKLSVSAVSLDAVTGVKLTFADSVSLDNIVDFVYAPDENRIYLSIGRKGSLSGGIAWVDGPFDNNDKISSVKGTSFYTGSGFGAGGVNPQDRATTAPIETLSYSRIGTTGFISGMNTCAPGFSVKTSKIRAGTGTLTPPVTFNVFQGEHEVFHVQTASKTYLMAWNAWGGTFFRIGQEFIDGSHNDNTAKNGAKARVLDPLETTGLADSEFKTVLSSNGGHGTTYGTKILYTDSSTNTLKSIGVE